MLAAFCLVAMPAWAAPFAVQLGGARVALDVPAGFADTLFTGSPRLQELAESLTSPSNRILVFAISDGDLRRFTLGDTPDFRRHLMVVTPKGAERERVTPDAFKRFAGDALRDMGKPPADADYPNYLEQQPAGRSSLLAELRRDATAISLLQGLRLPPTKSPGMFSRAEPSRFVLSSTSLVLLRGRGLNLSVFTMYESPADLDWIRAITLRWIEDLQRLNSR
ncbi:MAG TPA: hypothetical protein VI730_04030 [Burkholderiales bacterium]|nr:hypothetical protein [Burkholderiales bacterium]